MKTRYKTYYNIPHTSNCYTAWNQRNTSALTGIKGSRYCSWQPHWIDIHLRTKRIFHGKNIVLTRANNCLNPDELSHRYAKTNGAFYALARFLCNWRRKSDERYHSPFDRAWSPGHKAHYLPRIRHVPRCSWTGAVSCWSWLCDYPLAYRPGHSLCRWDGRYACRIEFCYPLGSVGFFGPITVHPDLWDRGIGKQLIAPAMECFDRWHVTHAGLFTFAQSPKHIGLYQHYGFLPRFLTAIMSKPVHSPTSPSQWSTYSALPESERVACLRANWPQI